MTLPPNIHFILYNKFHDQFYESRKLWPAFINGKKLGIQCLCSQSGNVEYKVIDEKQWLLVKMKYSL
jgi:hypothetical protein